jgi:hypothetical protein
MIRSDARVVRCLDCAAIQPKNLGRSWLLLFILVVASPALFPAPGSYLPDEKGITKAAAKSCEEKLDRLTAFASGAKGNKSQTTRFTQDEVNSYLALEVSPKYHPSLKGVLFTFEESKLRCAASIDFDQLRLNATQLLTQLLAKMFTGVHRLSVYGTLVAKERKAHFKLEDARFDSTSLPNFLVEEIISAVGRKQQPPFDPMQPSEMPYQINRVEVHPGYITVYQ